MRRQRPRNERAGWTALGACPRDRFLFLLVCLYWLSQAFLIPLAPLGPTWAVWPTLSDILVLCMVPLVLCRGSQKAGSYPARILVKAAWAVLGLCAASFAIATLCYGRHDDLVMIGIYQIYRMFEYLTVLLATAHVAIDSSRWKVLRWVALSTFCLISAGILLVASGLVPASAAAPLIPALPSIAGPWAAYAGGSIEDAGFISYNHAYAGMQLILSGGVAYLCFEKSRRIRLWIGVLLLASTFVSRSRATLIVALVFLVALEWKQAKSNLLTLTLLCCVGGLWAARSFATEDLVARQSSSVSSLDDDGLSGRTDIWQDHLTYFSAHPLNVVFGAGYGYAGKASRNNAHMLPLHVITETGLVGGLIFLALQRQTLRLLRKAPLRVMRWTVWALLLTGLTQETLYPVAAFPQFLGFYLSALAIALRFADKPTGNAAVRIGHPAGSIREAT